MKKKSKVEVREKPSAKPPSTTHRRATQLPPNIKVKISPINDDEWRWEITSWGRMLAEGGNFPSHSKAEDDAWSKLGEVLKPRAHANAQKAYLRQKLKYWTTKRPYVVMHVVERLTFGSTKSETVRDARGEELRRWKKQDGVIGRPDIPTHHTAKHAGEVAAVVFDLMTQMGLVGKRADRWARGVIGGAYSNPDGESHIEVANEDANHDDYAFAAQFDDDNNNLTKDSPV